MLKFLKNLFSCADKDQLEATVVMEARRDGFSSPPQEKRSHAYRETILEKHGFQLPASDYEKSTLGQKYEKEGETEKAIACYEGCANNRADGSFTYNRLTVIYRRLGRKDDEVRILRKAILVYSKAAKSGQSRAGEKLKKFEERLRKLTDK